jgi:hypothetical protein
MDKLETREVITNAIRYWERGRVFYNLALVAVVVAVYVAMLPTSRGHLSTDLLLQLFMLAVFANVAYCAAYAADLLVQFSAMRRTWLRRRWILLLIGTLFAATIAQFIVRGLFGGMA